MAGFTSRDSAGVRITVNAEPEGTGRPMWRLSREPRLILGAGAGPGDQLFRVTAARRLSNGAVVVANSGTREILYFDSAGRRVASAGGEGEGPGEFPRGISALVVRPGDTVLAWSSDARRRSTFGPDGSLVDHVAHHGDVIPRFQNDGEVLADGTMFFLEFDVGSRSGTTPGRSRNWLVRVDPAGSRADTLEAWPATYGVQVDLPGSTGPLGSSRNVSALFTPTSVLGGNGRDRVVVGESGHATVAVHSAGEVIGRHSWSPRKRSASAEDIRAAKAAATSSVSSRRLEEAWDELGYEPLPAFRRVMVDRLGYVWAERYPLPSDTVGSWTILSPEGRWLGEVAAPLAVQPLEIGEGYVLARLRDELGVEMVAEFVLRRDVDR